MINVCKTYLYDLYIFVFNMIIYFFCAKFVFPYNITVWSFIICVVDKLNIMMVMLVGFLWLREKYKSVNQNTIYHW